MLKEKKARTPKEKVMDMARIELFRASIQKEKIASYRIETTSARISIVLNPKYT
jgi:hypothetical protein